MQKILLGFILVWCFQFKAQIVFEKTEHDFGDLESYSDRFVDIIVQNKGLKKEYLLSVKKPREVVYLVNGSLIEKDSAIVVRFQINPSKKGRFNYELEIYTSDKDIPTKIKLKGNLKDLPTDNLASFTACPDFKIRPQGKATNFDLTVITIDKNTRQVIPGALVTTLQNGQLVWRLQTDKKGKISKETPLGLSFFSASYYGYKDAEIGAYVNFQRNLIVLELEKNTNPLDPPSPISLPIDSNTIAQNHSTAVEIKQDSIAANQCQPVPTSLNRLDPEDFSDLLFKPINVVFVLDVSASMKQGEKMDLLKFAMFEFTNMLRPQDKIGIVTYANKAELLMAPTSGNDKENINTKISSLKAYGLTAGGDGIKMGYKQALKGFNPDAVNQIIVITDGAFNRNSNDYKRHIKKYKSKNISMSIVGIKNAGADEKEMREVALIAGGNYIPIFKLSDAQNNLKQEIRRQSYRF